MFSIYIIITYVALLAIRPTRRFAIAFAPWVVFACCYDWMRFYPNYEINPIDVKGLYDTEKILFGITATGGQKLILGEYFAIHHCALADLTAGLFYLCWVPVPLGFSLWLYHKKQYKWFIRFCLAFLFVNLIGFCGYYIHPAAPPWYAMEYGFKPILHTPGNVAGLIRFDQLLGFPVFQSIYGKNANVFAALPSLHAAYMLVTTCYAWASRQSKATVAVFAFICVGIWWTAVYTGHHYVVDVLLGILTALVGMALLEQGIFRIPRIKRILENYVSYLQNKPVSHLRTEEKQAE